MKLIRIRDTKTTLSLMILSIVLFSSCNYLSVEDEFTDTLSYDSIFTNRNYFERYVWATPPFFPDITDFTGSRSPGELATDNFFLQTRPTDSWVGVHLTQGNLTPDDLYNTWTWPDLYRIIRRANIILSKIETVPDLSTQDKRTFYGYAYFFRGWAYYHLLQNWGPILKQGEDIIESNREMEYYDRARSTYDESIEYICEQFEKAAENLPISVPVTQFGRPTRGAAYALIARLRLQAASPLFNGGTAARQYYGNWKRTTDGEHYVSQEYDEKKWALAADACKRVIDMGIYELHTVDRYAETPNLPANVPNAPFPDGAGGIDPFRSYKDMFDGEAVPYRNKELIWGVNSSSLTNRTRNSFPTQNYGGYNEMAVTQKMVDQFFMADGRSINNSSEEYPYSEEGFMTGAKSFSGYRLGGGQPPVHNMYNNREMRFYASIGFTGRYWPMESTAETGYNGGYFSYAYDGNAGKLQTGTNPNNYPITGYVITKYIHREDAWAGTSSTRLTKTFPIIRYAEILLAYAEALNNLQSSYTITNSDGETNVYSRDINEIANSFNQVRYRVGLPGLTNEELADPNIIQELIIREKDIEFFGENHRFYDVRRWGIYLEIDRPEVWAYGLNTDARLNDGFFEKVPISHKFIRDRVTNRAYVWLPIARSELRKVPLMDQNPGWN